MRFPDNDWRPILEEEAAKPYFRDLMGRLSEEVQTHEIYPPEGEIFAALEATPLSKVKVVILGQDPYHGQGQAHGLSFSVRKGTKVPPSLKNIYRELEEDLGCEPPDHGYLMPWADQGVLLLNTVLTVRKGEAHAHRKWGWEAFTDRVIDAINDLEVPVVFLLWGNPAIAKAKRLKNPDHLILTAPHPSPLSAYRGYFGCRHFSKANAYLEHEGREPIAWCIR